jgi:hypothetical protein
LEGNCLAPRVDAPPQIRAAIAERENKTSTAA